jgi:putative membrane protein
MLGDVMHVGRAPEPHDLWTAWSWEPLVLLALATGAGLYARGSLVLAHRTAESPAGHAGRAGTSRRARAAAFWAGWAALVLALVSPVHALGSALFSAHMIQHELLVALAAPLLVLGRPAVPALWALPARARRATGAAATHPALRRLWGVLTQPVAAGALHAVALWTWHLPGPYQATLRSEWLHALQHATFLLTALAFWWAALPARRAGIGGALVLLFVTAGHTSILGALLALAPEPWYPAYTRTTPAWGLTLLEDQQLAGFVMWMPACLAYLAAALWLVAAWLRDAGRRGAHGEHQAQDGHRVPRAYSSGAALLLAGALLGACTPDHGTLSSREAALLTGGDVARGRAAIGRYGCGSCHTIAGVPGATSLVGPPLVGIGERAYIAGVISNDPTNLQRWIRDPRGVDSLTAMPDLGVTEQDARDIAAYLYAQR